MSDIIVTARYFKKDVDGTKIPIARVSRFHRNKYSLVYQEKKALLDEKQALERVLHEKENSQLQETK